MYLFLAMSRYLLHYWECDDEERESDTFILCDTFQQAKEIAEKRLQWDDRAHVFELKEGQAMQEFQFHSGVVCYKAITE